jgi:uncharacterized protein YndB with AHSA1/START domain
VSHWHIKAPREQVWEALTRPEDWPRWWPHVRAVQSLRRGQADGTGARRRLHWRTRLGYGFSVVVDVVEAHRPERLRARASGHMAGEGVWLLHAAATGGTQATYLWRVQLHRPWMRALSPLLAPLFRWSHAGVMRAGERGLARYLAPR